MVKRWLVVFQYLYATSNTYLSIPNLKNGKLSLANQFSTSIPIQGADRSSRLCSREPTLRLAPPRARSRAVKCAAAPRR